LQQHCRAAGWVLVPLPAAIPTRPFALNLICVEKRGIGKRQRHEVPGKGRFARAIGARYKDSFWQ
jgi:hypothetical protein